MYTTIVFPKTENKTKIRLVKTSLYVTVQGGLGLAKISFNVHLEFCVGWIQCSLYICCLFRPAYQLNNYYTSFWIR